MSWISITLTSYFLLAIVAILDKFLLTKEEIKPKIYAFYVGVLGILSIILIPFGFILPSGLELGLAFLSGALWIFALIGLYESFNRFEISRIVPAIGGFLPIFTLSLTYLFAWRMQNVLGSFGYFKIISLILLISGSVLISLEKRKSIVKKSLIFAGLTAFLFSLSFTLARIVYMDLNFISGFVWMRIAGFIVALFLIFTKEVREELFKKKNKNRESLFNKPKTALLFLFNQAMGGVAVVLQNIAIYSVPAIYLAFINAFDGARYVFLLILTIIISKKFPKVLSEKITKPFLIRKILAMILIIGGLIILVIN